MACPDCGFPVAAFQGGNATLETIEAPPSDAVTGTASEVAPTVYSVALGLGIASIFLGGTFGLIAWGAVSLSAWALYSERARTRRWMAWVGLALGFAFAISSAYQYGHLDAVFRSARLNEVAPNPTTTQPQSVFSPEPTIGVSLTDFIEAWTNTAGDDPQLQFNEAEYEETVFSALIGNDGSIQVFNNHDGEVTGLYVGSSARSSLKSYLNHTCLILIERDCANTLFSYWRPPSDPGIVERRQQTLEGFCWSYSAINGHELAWVDPESWCG